MATTLAQAVLFACAAAGGTVRPARVAVAGGASTGGSARMADNFIVRLGKSERQKAIDAWEIGDAWRPGSPNRWTKSAKDLVALHTSVIAPAIAAAPAPTGLPPYASTATKDGDYRVVPLVGAMMRTLTLADLALELSSPEPPVLKALRQADVRALPMSEAINGVPEEVGRMLTALCLAMGARRTLDLGSFSGYSALSAALGMPEGGAVTCCEPNPRYAAMAREALGGVLPTRATVELLPVDADAAIRTVLERGESGTFDLVFVDADPPGFERYFEAAHALLRPGGLLILHDTLWSEDRDLASGDHPRQRALNARVARDRRWSSLLLPFSFGLTFAVKTIDARGVPPAQPEALRGSGAAGCDPGVPTALADEAKYAVACNAYIGWLEARRAAVLSELATLA